MNVFVFGLRLLSSKGGHYGTQPIRLQDLHHVTEMNQANQITRKNQKWLSLF